MKKQSKSEEKYVRVTNDRYGNPRYVFHFFEFINEKDKEDARDSSKGYLIALYEIAIKKAKRIGGTSYKGGDFGGGIAMKSYNIEETIKDIKGTQKQSLGTQVKSKGKTVAKPFVNKGLKKDGTLRKGYKYIGGGKIVKINTK